jgi:hypothetical protein
MESFVSFFGHQDKISGATEELMWTQSRGCSRDSRLQQDTIVKWLYDDAPAVIHTADCSLIGSLYTCIINRYIPSSTRIWLVSLSLSQGINFNGRIAHTLWSKHLTHKVMLWNVFQKHKNKSRWWNCCSSKLVWSRWRKLRIILH